MLAFLQLISKCCDIAISTKVPMSLAIQYQDCQALENICPRGWVKRCAQEKLEGKPCVCVFTILIAPSLSELLSNVSTGTGSRFLYRTNLILCASRSQSHVW